MTRARLLVVMAITVMAPLFVLGIVNVLVGHAGSPTGGHAPGTVRPKPSDLSKVGAARENPADGLPLGYWARGNADTSGFQIILASLEPWDVGACLDKVAESWKQPGLKAISRLEKAIGDARDAGDLRAVIPREIMKAMLLQSEGQPKRSYEVLQEVRSLLAGDPGLQQDFLYNIIYLQGVSGLRRGENDNCVDCRGESACILPISPAAVHRNETGSRLAIHHFSEYLEQFPDDLMVRWLLNLAHMTLGEHPGKVDPRFLISLDRYLKSEFDIGKFRDVGHLAGVDRFNQSGGAIMEDFDNDGLLDIVVSAMDPIAPLALYRNLGNGVFEDRSNLAHLTGQLGGLYCVQTDYNNDGLMDVYVTRGAWLPHPIRPSLLRNDGGGTFTDTTAAAGLMDPVNSISVSWSDYDNDGWLDLFVCCELQPNRLYHNRGDGTFEEVSGRAGLRDLASSVKCTKGSAWIDFDNDDYPDLFVNDLAGPAQLYHNNRDGTFTNATSQLGVDGPRFGFSCWAWDYDNDGWLDIFATSYDRTLVDIVKGLLGEPHSRESNRLFHNVNGRSFENATKEKGLDMVFATMGSNYGDFDNDGFLDIYLGTGDPDFATLIPNRMFKNVEGKRFSEITGSSGTGHLQKGHGVACGDWDRDGDIDLFVETGGPTNGDKFRNILFQNPGQGNHWLTVKLVGKRTNRAAIGARIKVVTAGEKPLTIHRHVSSGSSFGANPLQQTIGLAQAERVALLEIHWPTSGTTQVFCDISADQAIEVTEFAKSYRPLNWRAIPQPE
jgi:hypothetical protein